LIAVVLRSPVFSSQGNSTPLAGRGARGAGMV
jgi:hypothetical protein